MHHQHRRDLDAELAYMAEKHADLMPEGHRFAGRAVARKAAGDERLAGHRIRAAAAYLRMGLTDRSHTDFLRGVALLGGEPVVARLKSAASPEVPLPEWLEMAIREPGAPDMATDAPVARSLEATT
jgi:hypothetical protein